jgi:Mg-chelatase subunit ChlD
MKKRRSRFHLGYYLLMVGLCLGLLVGVAPPAAASPPLAGVPSLDIMLVIDQSRTMVYYSDVESWRIAMASLFADLLSVDQSGASHQLGAVMFGNNAELISPLSNIQDQVVRGNFNDSLILHNENMGATNIPEAIRTAQTELDEHGREDAVQAIVLLSDFVCEFHAGMTLEETQACHSQIRTLASRPDQENYPIFIISLTTLERRNSSNYAMYWAFGREIANLTNALYFEPNNPQDELLNTYLQIIRHLFGLQPGAPPVITQGSTEITFEVPEDLQQVVFTVFKFQEGISSEVTDPTGRLIGIGSTEADVIVSRSDSTDVYSFQEPQAGTWTVRLDGDGTANIFTIEFPRANFTVDVELPDITQTYPRGKPMDISIHVLNQAQESQAVNGLTIDVVLPDASIRSLALEQSENLTYRGRLEDTAQAGTYTLQIRSPGEGSEGQVEEDITINVVESPWLRLLQPAEDGAYPYDIALEVQAQLMSGTEPFVPGAGENVFIGVDVLDNNGQPVANAQLTLESSGRAIGTVSLPEGTYILHSTMVYQNSNNNDHYTDENRFSFMMKGVSPATITPTWTPLPTASATLTFTLTPLPTIPPPPMPTPIPPAPPKPVSILAILGILGGLIVLAGGGVAGWWWFNQPALVGTLESSSGEWIPLSGKRSVSIGSDRHCQVIISDLDVQARHAQIRASGSRKNPQVEIRTLTASAVVKVNGLETTYQILQDGDKIEIGNQKYTISGMPGRTFDTPADPGGWTF